VISTAPVSAGFSSCAGVRERNTATKTATAAARERKGVMATSHRMGCREMQRLPAAYLWATGAASEKGGPETAPSSTYMTGDSELWMGIPSTRTAPRSSSLNRTENIKGPFIIEMNGPLTLDVRRSPHQLLNRLAVGDDAVHIVRYAANDSHLGHVEQRVHNRG